MGAPCPACRWQHSRIFVVAPRDREYFVSRRLPAVLLRCGRCRSLFQDPLPDANEAASFYPPGYQNYVASSVPLIGRAFLALQHRTADAFIRRYGPTVSVLDFGCGPGFFLEALATRGATRLTGFDFAAQESPLGQHFRFVSDLSELRGEQSYDVIRMNHVIEHLTDPDAMMSRLRSLLAPGGTIIGQTPNATHYTASIFGTHWGALHYPFHTIIFSPTGLTAAAERWRLAVAASSPTVLPTGWAMSLENLTKAFLASRAHGRSVFYPLWLAASVPFVLADRMSGHTAVFDFELVRAGAP